MPERSEPPGFAAGQMLDWKPVQHVPGVLRPRGPRLYREGLPGLGMKPAGGGKAVRIRHRMKIDGTLLVTVVGDAQLEVPPHSLLDSTRCHQGTQVLVRSDEEGCIVRLSPQGDSNRYRIFVMRWGRPREAHVIRSASIRSTEHARVRADRDHARTRRCMPLGW